MKAKAAIVILLLFVIGTSTCSSALPFSSVATVSRKVSIKVTVNPLSQIKSIAEVTTISVRNNFSYPLTLYVHDIETDVEISEYSDPPVAVEKPAESLYLITWKVKVDPFETKEIRVDSIPKEELPLHVRMYYIVNGEEIKPVKEGQVWKLKVNKGDKITLCLKFESNLPRLFDGLMYEKSPISVLVSMPFPDDILEFEEANVPQSQLMANSWILTVYDESWLNATFKVKSLGAWGEVNLDPISISYSIIQQANPALDQQISESHQLSETLSALASTADSLRTGIHGISSALSAMSETLKTPLPENANREAEYGLSQVLEQYSKALSKAASSLAAMSSEAKNSLNLLTDVILTVDPSLITNPTPELQQLMMQLTMLSVQLKIASAQLSAASVGIRELSTGVGALENATTDLSKKLTQIANQLNVLSNKLGDLAEQASLVGKGMNVLETTLTALSNAYSSKEALLTRQKSLLAFQRRYYTTSRAWGTFKRYIEKLPVGYKLINHSDRWRISKIEVKNEKKCTILWLLIRSHSGRVLGVEFENQPENLTSTHVKLLDNGSAVAIPIFSTDSGELEHPILGKFSVEIKASSSEDIEMYALATCGDKYIHVEDQKVTYSISLEVPTLSRKVQIEIPSIKEEKKTKRPLAEYLIAAIIAAALLALAIRWRPRKRVEDHDLAEIEKELEDLEKILREQ